MPPQQTVFSHSGVDSEAATRSRRAKPGPRHFHLSPVSILADLAAFSTSHMLLRRHFLTAVRSLRHPVQILELASPFLSDNNPNRSISHSSLPARPHWDWPGPYAMPCHHHAPSLAPPFHLARQRSHNAKQRSRIDADPPACSL